MESDLAGIAAAFPEVGDCDLMVSTHRMILLFISTLQ